MTRSRAAESTRRPFLKFAPEPVRVGVGAAVRQGHPNQRHRTQQHERYRQAHAGGLLKDRLVVPLPVPDEDTPGRINAADLRPERRVKVIAPGCQLGCRL